MANLILYYFPGCPFCQKVLNYLEENNIDDVTLKNTRKDDQAREELVNTGGKYQVPCLFIDGEPLYESEDIISWFKENYSREGS